MAAAFGILTSGDVSSVPNTALFADRPATVALTVRGNTDRDVTVLKTDISVPAGANCLTFDFKFLSEEYPGFVGTPTTTRSSPSWTTRPGRPRLGDQRAEQLRVRRRGQVVSINSTGLGGTTAAEGAGTAFDGTRPTFSALRVSLVERPAAARAAAGRPRAPTRSTSRSSTRATTARLGRLPRQPRRRLRAEPGGQLCPGATPVNFKLDLTPATATNPVGTPHTVTATLTERPVTPIAGAPISFTVTGVNPPGPGTNDERERPGDLHLHRYEHRQDQIAPATTPTASRRARRSRPRPRTGRQSPTSASPRPVPRTLSLAA